MSYYFYHKNRDREYYKNIDINEFVMKHYNFKRAILRINKFSNQLKKSKEYIIIPYEKIKGNPKKYFKEIINFTEYEFNKKAFNFAVKKSNFKSLRKLESKNKNYSKNEQYHVRKGGNKTYREYLNNESIRYINKTLKKELKGILKPYYIGTINDNLGD